MADPQALTVRAITAQEAAARLGGVAQLDPSGIAASADDLAAAGRAFAIEGEAGQAVYVVAVRNGVAFVIAAKGSGSIDLTEVLDRVVTAQSSGLQSIAFQTARPGLVRKLQKRGFRVAGWVMKKDLQ